MEAPVHARYPGLAQCVREPGATWWEGLQSGEGWSRGVGGGVGVGDGGGVGGVTVKGGGCFTPRWVMDVVGMGGDGNVLQL